MIMVIGGRCQGKASFAREHFKDRSLKIENEQKKKTIPEQIPGQMAKQSPGKSFLLPPGAEIFICWCAGF